MVPSLSPWGFGCTNQVAHAAGLTGVTCESVWRPSCTMSAWRFQELYGERWLPAHGGSTGSVATRGAWFDRRYFPGHHAPGTGAQRGVHFSSHCQTGRAGVALSLALAVIVCFLIANTVAQFSRYLPTSGGYYTFVTHGLGPHLGFLTTWSYLIYDIVGPAGAIGYLGYHSGIAAGSRAPLRALVGYFHRHGPHRVGPGVLWHSHLVAYHGGPRRHGNRDHARARHHLPRAAGQRSIVDGSCRSGSGAGRLGRDPRGDVVFDLRGQRL